MKGKIYYIKSSIFNLYSILPLYYFSLSIFLCNFTLSMNFTIFPCSLNDRSISQNKNSFSILFVKIILTFEYLTIFPIKLAVSMHHVIFPFTVIISTILIGKFSFTFKSILFKLTHIRCAIWP